MRAWRDIFALLTEARFADLANENKNLLTLDSEVESEPEKYYDKVL